MFTIRAETSEDVPAVRRVNEQAFARVEEAALVDALRAAARPYISLVAVEDEKVVGHIFFSTVEIVSADGEVRAALGLAPMAVLPEHQRSGIGSQLVREGLKECRRLGHTIVVVLGHAEYYPRFGFRPAREWGLRCEYDVPDEVFMATELRPGALADVEGVVKYRPEFGGV